MANGFTQDLHLPDNLVAPIHALRGAARHIKPQAHRAAHARRKDGQRSSTDRAWRRLSRCPSASSITTALHELVINPNPKWHPYPSASGPCTGSPNVSLTINPQSTGGAAPARERRRT